MKTACCAAYGPPETLQLIQRDLPDLRAGEVRVQVNAAGVGFVDGLLIQGKYQIKPPLPYYPGSEFAGEVLALGSNVTNLAVGDRVMGLGNGTYAEQINIHANACIPIPKSNPGQPQVDDSIAAGLVINYATALYGLRDCGALQPNETLLVLGAGGGVGTAAIGVARAMGAQVIAAASSAAKLEVATQAGAHAGVLYSEPKWRDAVKELASDTPSGGLNMVYDPVGGQVAEPALRSLAPGGRFLVVGFASGSIPSIALNLALLKRCSIVGVDWGGAGRADPSLTPALLTTIVDWLQTQKLQPPPITVRPLSDVRGALADQLQGKTYGKLVLNCRQ
jgi:NADPH2:quinone reductase